jgi:hypothetical protein
VSEKVKQYLQWGCKTKIVLLTKKEHEKLHKDALAYSLAQYKGAIVHNNVATLHSGEAMIHLDSYLNYSVRCLAWQRRAEIWNAPERVQFT